jgi:hypothetical protein
MVGFGNDLATVMYYHKMTQSNPGCWTVDLNGGTTWAMGEYDFQSIIVHHRLSTHVTLNARLVVI